MPVAAIVVQALNIVAAIAPGLLAAMTNHSSDAEAIAAAQHAIDEIPHDPARTAIEKWREALARAKR